MKLNSVTARESHRTMASKISTKEFVERKDLLNLILDFPLKFLEPLISNISLYFGFSV